ncbi:MAG: MFS transporter [Pseudomonadota bacterium]
MIRHWLPALAGMLCLALGAGLIGVYGFFVEPLAAEFGVGLAVMNVGPVALLLVPGLFGPIIGRLADRLPIRRLVFAGACIASFALLAISQSDQLAWIALSWLLFSLGLTFYGPVVINGLMIKLYPGREARALAIAAIGISVASIILPPLIGTLLDQTDWRSTLRLMSAGLFVCLSLTLLAIPDGIAGAAVQDSRPRQGIYRRREFWLIGLCVAVGLNVAIVLAVCYPAHFIDAGYSKTQVGGFIAAAGTAGLVGKACIAWLGDAGRHFAKWLAMMLLLVQGAGLLALVSVDGSTALVLVMLCMGFAGGAFIPMHPYLNSRYFDAAVIGEVNGAQMPLFLPFGLVGAPLAGYAYDQLGNYDTVFVALAGIYVLAALLALALPVSRTET